MTRMIKWIAALLCMLALLAPMQALAQMDTGRPVSLTLSFQRGNLALTDAQFDLFYVAGVDIYGKLTPVRPFDQYRLDYSPENWMQIAPTLEGLVFRDGIEPALSAKTDEQGMIRFEQLRQGVYLVVGHRHVQAGMVYDIQPFLLQLPSASPDTHEWLYDVTVRPKYVTWPDTQGTVITRKVLKAWDDEGYEWLRPKKITVHLLKNGEIEDTVELSAENNWRYEWTGLSNEFDWLVVEERLPGYTTVVVQQGITFLMTNTYITATPTPVATPTPTLPPYYTNPPGCTATPKPTATPTPYYGGSGSSSTPTPTPTLCPGCTPTLTPLPTPTLPPKLPQTGQIWWPVPLLVSGGIVLILLGVIRRRGDEYEE